MDNVANDTFPLSVIFATLYCDTREDRLRLFGADVDVDTDVDTDVDADADGAECE